MWCFIHPDKRDILKCIYLLLLWRARHTPHTQYTNLRNLNTIAKSNDILKLQGLMTLLWLHSSQYWSQLVYSYCHWVPLHWEIPLFLTFNLLRLQLKACNITGRLKLIDTIFAFTYILYVPPHDSVIHHKPLTSLPSLSSLRKNSRPHQESSFSIRYRENKQDGWKLTF